MVQNKLGKCKQNSDTLTGATKGTFTQNKNGKRFIHFGH